MNSINVTAARKSLYHLVDSVNESKIPLTIEGKRGSAVLISAEDWSAIQETLFLNQIPGMSQSIQEGLAEDPENCSDELTW